MARHTDTLRALENLSDPDINSTPKENAERAFNNGQELSADDRSMTLMQLASSEGVAGTATASALMTVLYQSQRGQQVLEAVGYQTVRHLRALGLSLSQICDDLHVNMHDLTEFMALSPSAAADAELDAEAFADRKASELLSKISHMTDVSGTANKLSRDEVECLKIESSFLLEYNKRLSNKWAQREGKELTNMPKLVINLGDKGTRPPPVIVNQDAGTVTNMSGDDVEMPQPDPDLQGAPAKVIHLNPVDGKNPLGGA